MAIRSEYTAELMDFFDEHEDHRLLIGMTAIMLDMIPFNWENTVLWKRDLSNIYASFLDSQEVLLGKSFCDLFLRKPRMIHDMLKQ